MGSVLDAINQFEDQQKAGTTPPPPTAAPSADSIAARISAFDKIQKTAPTSAPEQDTSAQIDPTLAARRSPVPFSADQADDREAAASQDRTTHFQDILDKNNVGGKYSDEPGNLGFKAQFQMARSDNEDDARKAFLQQHPNGDLISAVAPDGSKQFLYKTDPSDNWHPVRLGLGNVAATATDPRVLLSAGAAAASSGASLPVQIGLQAAAGGAGSLINYGIQKLQGFDQNKTLGQVAGDTAVDTGVGALGGAIPGARQVPGALKDAATGALQYYYDAGAAAARAKGVGHGALYQTAADALGLPGPSIGQATSNEMIGARYRQVLSTPAVQADLDAKRAAVGNKLRELSASGETLSSDQLQKLQSMDLQDAHDALAKQNALPQGATTSDAGRATQLATQNYDQSSKAALDAKVAEVENNAKLDDVSFNINKLKSIWQDVKSGVVGVGNNVDKNGVADAVQLSTPSPALQAIGGKLEDLSKTMENADLTRSMPSGTNRRVAPTTTTFSAIRQLSTIRDQLATVANAGGADAPVATRMLSEVDNVMANPKGASPELTQGISDLTDLQGQRSSNLALLRGQLNASNAGKLGTGIIAPGNGRQIDLIKNQSPESFSTIQDAFRGQLANGNPTTIFKRFASDQPTLDAVIPPEEQKAWLGFGQAKRALNTLTSKQSQNEAKGAVSQLINAGPAADPAGLNGLVAKSMKNSGATNSWDTPVAQQARAELYSNVIRAATERTNASGGADVLNTSRAQAMLRDIEQNANGKWSSIMGPADKENLKNLGIYLSSLDLKAGGQLSKAEIARHLFSPLGIFENPKSWALSLAKVFNSDGLGHIFSEPASGKLAAQAIQSGSSIKGIRMMTGAMALAIRSATSQGTRPSTADLQ